ncbi:NAD(P)/FAD-dependent oxidoreductase [Kineothrix sedimenti]|uniref:NAD(P)/FAD-dependent oxidoreductase n=1 Tax=Kineothrix sedimenti TaxID=3123317 RepID=A0ABZ3ESD6_9FIRM
MSRIIVIGGGAAGMMAAVAAAENGGQVLLFEKNEKLGKKVYITGKGRCNLTNACDMESLFGNVVTNGKFLYSAFYGFDNQAVIRFFEEAGCKTKIERGERVFPVSDHSSDVIAALHRQMKGLGVDIRLNTSVKTLVTEEDRVIGVVTQDGGTELAEAVIVAAGGLSYPVTGSTGDGYRMAEEKGHSTKPCYPSLVPLIVKEDWCKELQGLSLKNVTVALCQNGKKVFYEGFGEMLFTHFGVSGPLILSASSYYTGRKSKENVSLYLDLKPALSEEQLDKRVLRDFEENKNKQFKNSLGSLFPAKLIPVIIRLSGIDGEKKIHEVTKEERFRFVHLIKHIEMTITGTREFQEAIITKGGISVKEVNPSTMESKLVKGLYFAGEVLDVDALTGGFNLQIAWSTGYLAGSSAAKI